MLRGLVKSGFANTLQLSGASGLIARLGRRRSLPLILGYHRVAERFSPDAAVDIPSMITSTAMLRRHLEWVAARFRFASLDEIGARLESGEGFDGPVAAVTFDDGYEDVYQNALPILRAMGIPACVFVVTDLAGTSRLQIHDRLYIALARLFRIRRRPARALAALLDELGMEVARNVMRRFVSPFPALGALLKSFPQSRIVELLAHLEVDGAKLNGNVSNMRPLSWSMIREMHDAGITIGSHTRTHALLTNESSERIGDELASSRRELEDALGAPVRHLAYPDGRFNAAVVQAVRQAGYRFAYTTCRHRDASHPFLTVPRRVLWERACIDTDGRFQPAIMECQINGMFDLVSPCVQDHDRLRDPVEQPTGPYRVQPYERTEYR